MVWLGMPAVVSSSAAARAASAVAENEMSGALPGVAGGVETERLAGPGRGDHDIDRPSRGGQRGDHLELFLRERRHAS